MRYRDGRRSLCLSSQSGCPLTCTFCATGQMAFGRNLTASEILDQALHFRRLTPVDHAVFMGMGEPMLNFDEVVAAARKLPDVGITHRRTTISTVGWLPGLKRFVDEVDVPIRLALSLHAPDDELRSTIMPVNDKYPLRDILAECRRHVERTNRRVYIEYVMLAGVNDSPEQAQGARQAARARSLQGEPHSVQPHGHVRRLLARPHRRVQARTRPDPRAVDGASHTRPRHRSGVRAACNRTQSTSPQDPRARVARLDACVRLASVPECEGAVRSVARGTNDHANSLFPDASGAVDSHPLVGVDRCALLCSACSGSPSGTFALAHEPNDAARRTTRRCGSRAAARARLARLSVRRDRRPLRSSRGVRRAQVPAGGGTACRR